MTELLERRKPAGAATRIRQRNVGRAPVLAGVATSVTPESYTQRELLDRFEIADPRVRSLFLNGGIEHRHLTLPTPQPGTPRPVETQGELLRKHLEQGIAMGREAVAACLAHVGASPEDVALVCCVSSTGFLAPGFSAYLIRELGLPANCARLDIVGMGCNAGLNALAATCGWSTANPGELALLVCIEVCSAAYVFDGSMRTSVVNSLFGDGAAALAVIADEHVARAPAVVDFESCIVTDAIDAMRYDWDDESGKFSFFLDPQIPYVVGAHAEGVVDALLSRYGLVRSDVDHWLVHSGGKKVIDAVRVNLRLTRHDVRHTLSVLRDFGNVSSASFLFSYERLLAERAPAPGDHGLMMTMGPGSTIETALLRW